MADQPEHEDTLRGPKHYLQSEQKQLAQHGGDELAPETAGQDARENPDKQRENRKKMGVNEEHRTDKMQKGHRRTFP